MPSMSSLRRVAVVALAGGAAFTWVSAVEVPIDALVEEEACSADDQECSLSLRQLRGEQKTVQAVEHAFSAPDEAGAEPAAAAVSGEPTEEQGVATEKAEAEGAATEKAGTEAEAEGAATEEAGTEAEAEGAATEEAGTEAEAKGAATEEAGTEAEAKAVASEEPAEPTEAATAKRTIEAAAEKPTTKADDDDEDDDDDDDEDDDTADTKDDDDDDDDDDEDDDDDDDEDDEDDDEDDEEETVYGEFCCQFGQGRGAWDLSDVGRSCYPSAKPERYDFCDDKSACGGKCNGTWVTGFCAFNATPGAKDACALELNAKATGYEYTSSLSRAVGNATCAASESACGGCNGTWCHYVKTPVY